MMKGLFVKKNWLVGMTELQNYYGMVTFMYEIFVLAYPMCHESLEYSAFSIGIGRF